MAENPNVSTKDWKSEVKQADPKQSRKVPVYQFTGRTFYEEDND